MIIEIFLFFLLVFQIDIVYELYMIRKEFRNSLPDSSPYSDYRNPEDLLRNPNQEN